MPLLTLQNVGIHFIGPPLLEHAELRIEPGERICLLGRNGAGKTTLLRLIDGQLEPDTGEIIREPGIRIARLNQQVPRGLEGSIFDQLHAELADDFVEEPWRRKQEIETVLSKMSLDGGLVCESLSAGMKRRVLLAKALVRRPDLLLLDEPTNHLDLGGICWLEEFLLRWSGTLMFVTHDRMFLRKLATRIVEIDRGQLIAWDCDHQTYLDRKQAALETEAKQRALFDKRLAQEETWIRGGILARRTRNEGRVRALKQMRQQRVERRELPGQARMQLQEAERTGRLVIKAKGVTFAYDPASNSENTGTLEDTEPIIRGLSTSIMRGDKIGIIGPNGAGKTTLLRLLLDELQPQQGTIRHGTRLQVAYFDQLHAELDEEQSVQDNVSGGSESVMVGGVKKHILGYLQEFLFTPEEARNPVKRLSGGERNRLLLARLFTKPANVLVMDEPTNDLDSDTLELLEEILVDYQGTLLIVSHDRDFLNNVVTSTLVLEGQGRVKEYAGGYDDWLTQRKQETSEAPKKPAPKAKARQEDQPRRLKYGEKIELETLPAKIEALEAKIEQFHTTMSAPEFYEQDHTEVVKVADELKQVEAELAVVYARWEELESLE